MEQRRRGRWITRLAALAAMSVTVAGLAAGCASGAGSQPAPANTAAADIEAALQEPTTLTVWTWSTVTPDVAKAFEAEYPKIKVNVVNVGNGHYQKLENAIKAGNGAPDIATMEYHTLPQFALSGSLVELSQFGFQKYEDEFVPGAWKTVNVDGGLYELPHNAGPMALFYNKTVFDKFGVEVPTTWDEYLDAARKIHAADPESYIAADTGNSGLTTSLIWAFGGEPFTSTSKTDLTINMKDKGTQAYADFYQQLLDEGLLAPIPGSSNDWYQGLTNGKIASLATGAWMANSLATGVKDGAGQWRVAPLPTVKKGEKASAMNGGGGFAIMKQSKNQLAAAGFLEWMETGAGRDVWIKAGQFPSMKADLQSKEFLEMKNDYFGGQQINKIFVQSAEDVLPGWQYLPFTSYADSIFGDSVGQAYLGKTTLKKGLAEWGDSLAQYAEEQGFTVSRK
ncbi:ABC transporter substrate-binding protein [Microbacterium sp. 179-I 3D2 NHS]|uniref:ABC transporter substrate-binding protein n=1 Tax=Microbacterium sp. 179-I 3D2 NHS TaxID=3235178 RepID=UPI0039A0EA79